MADRNYDHTIIKASSPKELRRALLRAAAMDHPFDLEIGLQDDPSLVRHTVHVNGRQIGYEARRQTSGHYRLTEIGNLQHKSGRFGPTPRKLTKDDYWFRIIFRSAAAYRTEWK
jgi:hypothetical protein